MKLTDEQKADLVSLFRHVRLLALLTEVEASDEFLQENFGGSFDLSDLDLRRPVIILEVEERVENLRDKLTRSIGAAKVTAAMQAWGTLMQRFAGRIREGQPLHDIGVTDDEIISAYQANLDHWPRSLLRRGKGR